MVCYVIVLQAECASGDRFSAAGEGLIIDTGVCDRPVEVFPGQGLTSILPVVGDPAILFIITLILDNGCLIGPQFGGFVWESSAENCRHCGESFHPLGNVRDGNTSGVTSDISTYSRSSIFFTTLGGREAAGLNGPAVRRELVPMEEGVMLGVDIVPPATDLAAAASRSRPDVGEENKGRLLSVGNEEEELPVGWIWVTGMRCTANPRGCVPR